MSTSTWIVLDAIDQMRTSLPALKVNGSYPPLRATSVMSDGDPSRVVTTSLAVALLGVGQRQEGSALPQVIVDRTLQMTDTGCSRLVGAHDDGVIVCFLDGGGSCGRLAGFRGGLLDGLLPRSSGILSNRKPTKGGRTKETCAAPLSRQEHHGARHVGIDVRL